MITLDDVTFRYRQADRPILNGVNLRIEKGESLCLMGANGSGKTTLARILAGLITRYEGSVTLDGRPADIREPRTAVGILFQNPDNQMVATLVDKEIAFGLENLAVPPERMKKQVAKTARQFQIESLLSRLTTELSGGEKQRVALASLMIQEPPVLILDEPDSFLDVAGRRILRDELARIKSERQDMTEIRITQYPSVAREYSRLVMLREGVVVADGSPSEILDNQSLLAQAGMTYTSHASHDNTVAPLVNEPSGPVPHSIRFSRVAFQFAEGRPVFRDLNLVISRGETVGVAGPTGAGKSSLGLLMCGIYQPTAGKMELLNREGHTVPSVCGSGRIVGLFQQPERQFFLTKCAAEIAFGPENIGLELTGEEVKAFFHLVGLDPDRFAQRDPLTLSMGEKRRLAFAAVMSMSPSIVIFDEPTCALDPEGVGRFIELAKYLRRQGVGQVVISHEMDVIKALADRLILLESDGSAREISVEQLSSDDRYARILAPPSGILA